MRQLLMLLLALFGPFVLMAKPTQSINFLSWANYLSPATIPHFEKLTGIELNLSFYDGDDMLRTKLMADAQNYDLAMPDSADIPELIAAQVIEPIETTRLPNYAFRNLAAYQLLSKVDPHNQYALIYSYGTTGIAYNPKLVEARLGKPVEISDWKTLLDVSYLKQLKNCGVSFLDEPVQVFGIALHYLGLDPNSQDPKDYEKAADLLISLRPYLTYFDNNRYITDLAAGNLCIAMAYSGDSLRAKVNALRVRSDIEIKYVLPKSGAPIWFDVLVIPKGSKNKEATLQFLNYLLSETVSAQNSNFLYQPSATNGASRYYNALLKDNKALPDLENNETLFPVYLPKSASLKETETRLWMKVRYGIQ